MKMLISNAVPTSQKKKKFQDNLETVNNIGG
jgi:hypothetical protein